jgi:hypothetical protein
LLRSAFMMTGCSRSAMKKPIPANAASANSAKTTKIHTDG